MIFFIFGCPIKNVIKKFIFKLFNFYINELK